MSEEPRGPWVQEREAVREEPVYPPPAPVEREERYYRPSAPPERPTSALALASLATGISAYFIFPIAGAIAAIVTGFLAQNEIRASNGRLAGAAFATAGLVLGWVQIGIVVIVAIVLAIAASAAPSFQAGLPVWFGG